MQTSIMNCAFVSIYLSPRIIYIVYSSLIPSAGFNFSLFLLLLVCLLVHKSAYLIIYLSNCLLNYIIYILTHLHTQLGVCACDIGYLFFFHNTFISLSRSKYYSVHFPCFHYSFYPHHLLFSHCSLCQSVSANKRSHRYTHIYTNVHPQIRMYVIINSCTYMLSVYLFTNLSICILISSMVWMHIHVFAFVDLFLTACISVCACMFMNMYVHMYVYGWMHIHLCKRIYEFISYVCMYRKYIIFCLSYSLMKAFKEGTVF